MTAAYRHCKFCHGRGCLACPGERKRDQEKAAKASPAPITEGNTEGAEPDLEAALLFSADPNDPKDMKLLKDVIGREAIEHAFADDASLLETALTGRGGGVQEIERRAAIAQFIQALHRTEGQGGDQEGEDHGDSETT